LVKASDTNGVVSEFNCGAKHTGSHFTGSAMNLVQERW
jgi:hypothetical protein